LLCIALIVSTRLGVSAAAQDSAPSAAPVYELRIYHTHPGKLEKLHHRFRDHTMKLFEKHGIHNVAYFVPQDESKGSKDTLVYIVVHPSRDAAKKAWAEFGADPEWKKVREESEADGPIVAKVETVFLDATPYSPNPSSIEKADQPRVYELRTYKASPGKLAHLHKRFHDHTTKLFRKHGMTNVVYTTPQDADKGKDDTLIYLLAHSSRDAADKSWKAFGADPDWQKVYKDSQPDGVPLAAKVESLFLVPTDYSPMK
jgi:hypothetical protein